MNKEKQLNDGEPYKVFLRIFVDEKGINDKRSINDLLDRIVRIIEEGSSDIEIIDSLVLSIQEIAVDKYREFKKWNLDYLSYSGKPGGNTLILTT